ncbi:hypothetical protein GF325_09310 [Candidatus Bathyarchaeota archaeon]|nr:hypothetical protein [Candidatus Bathyarchaeota archaeon]
MDPFMGSGSSLVGARQAGINGAGFEVNPFLVTLSRAKMATYPSTRRLESAVDRVMKAVGKTQAIEIPVPKLSITEKLFREQLDELLRVKQAILGEQDETTRRFLLIGLGCIAQRISYAKKDGNGLKYPKNREPLELLPTLKQQYSKMITDISHREGKNQEHVNHLIVHGDSRIPFDHAFSEPGGASIESIVDSFMSSLKHVIFSPPYCNCFDYTEVYKIELWMLDYITEYPQLKKLRKKSLSSHLNKRYSDDVKPILPELDDILDIVPWDSTWGKEKKRYMVTSYFNDMHGVFENIDRLLHQDGEIVCVVGNSAYANVPIATDLFLSRMLKDLGYRNIEIRIARPLSTSSQQQKYLKGNPYLRESLIIARK